MNSSFVVGDDVEVSIIDVSANAYWDSVQIYKIPYDPTHGEYPILSEKINGKVGRIYSYNSGIKVLFSASEAQKCSTSSALSEDIKLAQTLFSTSAKEFYSWTFNDCRQIFKIKSKDSIVSDGEFCIIQGCGTYANMPKRIIPMVSSAIVVAIIMRDSCHLKMAC